MAYLLLQNILWTCGCWCERFLWA